MVINVATRISAATFLAAALGTAVLCQAQTRSDWIGAAGVEEDWDEGDVGAGEGINWLNDDSENFQPDRNFSTGGIALIDHAIDISPTDIRLAEDPGSTGTLVIRSGGSITVLEAPGGEGDGMIANGFPGGGAGTLVLRDNIGTVSIQRYSQTSVSTLVTQLGSHPSFANPVQVSQQITLDGMLRIERTPGSGFVAVSGNSWTIFQGAPVGGAFDEIDVDLDLVSNVGQVFSVSTAGNAVTLSMEQRLVLLVDRFTGATTIRNPSGHATNIELINYTLHSSTTPLDSTDARWKSFEDDPTKPGWFEANPTVNDLSELNPTGSLTMNPGVTHDFGTPLTANSGAALGTNRVNVDGVSLQYQLPTGEFVAAAVESVGRFNDLVLVVDPSDGSTLIQNQSAQSIELISYTISSESASLLSSWSGLQGLGEPGWFKANGTTSDLSELASADPLVLGEGEQRDLGFAWNTSGDDDLTFVYQDPTTGQLIDGTVHFGLPENISVGLAGDFNHDGTVDAADYVVWRKTNGSPAEYATWRANFGMTELGSGNTANSLVAIANQPVPEPTTCLLALLGTAFVAARRKSIGPWA